MKTLGCRYGLILLWIGLRPFAHAEDLQVGPGRQYPRPEAALAAAHAGDTISIYPLAADQPYDRVALVVTVPQLTIRAVNAEGKRVKLSGTGFDYSGVGRVPRAIVQFDPTAVGGRLAGFELSGARNESHNGAAVRVNQANQVTIENCEIHDNDMGIMSNGNGTPTTATDQQIENCLIYRNGSLEHPGMSHNLYLGGTSVRVRGCEIHSSVTGHNLKSRAHRTIVAGCYIHDSANRELDLVDADGDTTLADSDAVVVGNVIVKGADCAGNRGVLHFGQDGGHAHRGVLFLVHNTIVTPYLSAVIDLSAVGSGARLWNNVVWDGAAPQRDQVLVACREGAEQANVRGEHNWLAWGFEQAKFPAAALTDTRFGARGGQLHFRDADRGDFRPAAAESELVDQGGELPEKLQRLLADDFVEFQAPLGSAPRSVAGPLDLGAHEAAADPGGAQK